MSTVIEYNSLPTRVLMGPGSVEKAAEEVRRFRATRAMLFSGAKTAQTKLVARVIDVLGPLLVERFTGITEHSHTGLVEQAARLVVEKKIDLLIAVGGGSASDTAKAVAILVAEGPPLHRHANVFTPPDKLLQQNLDKPKLPLIAIPTTLSAAEVTPGLGIRDPEGRKLLFWDDKVAARTVILDPAANVEVPVPIIATSGMNAVAHCVEALYSKRRNPIADSYAMQGLRLLSRALPEVMRAPDSVEARAGALYGAHLSGRVIGSTRTCLHHGICHCLGALGGLSHGVANSIMLPHAMRFNTRVANPQLRLVAEAFGQEVAALSDAEAAERAIDAVVRLQKAIGVPTRLRDTGLSRDLLPKIAEHAMGDRALYFNPGPTPTQPEVLQVLQAAW